MAMQFYQWEEILDAVNTDKNLSKDNVINKIQCELKNFSQQDYEKWEKVNFDINHLFDVAIFGNNYNFTLLHLAAHNGYMDLAITLMKNSVNINLQDRYGRVPLHFAAECGHTALAIALIENGANVNAVDKDRYGRIPLHIAAECNYTDLAIALIENGANVNAVDKWRKSPLHVAVERSNVALVNAFIEKGANLNIMDKYHNTPLDYANKNGNKYVIEALLKAGARSFKRKTNIAVSCGSTAFLSIFSAGMLSAGGIISAESIPVIAAVSILAAGSAACMLSKPSTRSENSIFDPVRSVRNLQLL